MKSKILLIMAGIGIVLGCAFAPSAYNSVVHKWGNADLKEINNSILSSGGGTRQHTQDSIRNGVYSEAGLTAGHLLNDINGWESNNYNRLGAIIDNTAYNGTIAGRLYNSGMGLSAAELLGGMYNNSFYSNTKEQAIIDLISTQIGNAPNSQHTSTIISSSSAANLKTDFDAWKTANSSVKIAAIDYSSFVGDYSVFILYR